MEVVNAIMSVVMLLLMLGGVAFLCTIPGWLAGWATWSEKRHPRMLDPMTSPARRWGVWVVGGVLVNVGVGFIGADHLVLGICLLLLGAALGQYAAFSIGYATRDRRHAHRNDHLYAPLPEGLGPQHLTTPPASLRHEAPDMGETVDARVHQGDREPEVDRASIMSSTPSSMSTGTAEYPLAQPQDD